MADWERTWVDRHWQTRRGRGWTGNGRPGEDVGGQLMADQERTWVTGIGRLGEDVGGQALADEERTWVDR
jgi:hypothetical protein